MATIQYEVPNNVQRMTIGVQGENNVREFLFDVTEWRQITGDIGAAEMVVQRNGDASPYAAAITIHDENTVSWIPTSTDTEKVGAGKLQLMWIVSGQTVKTKIFDMKVDPSLDYAVPDTSLDPWASWMPGIINADAKYKNLSASVDSLQDQIASPFDVGVDVADLDELEAIETPAKNEAHYVRSEKRWYAWTGEEWAVASMSEAEYMPQLTAVRGAIDKGEIDLLSLYGTFEGRTHVGVTFEPIAHGFEVTGTATATAFAILYIDALPPGMSVGSKVYFEVSSTSEDLNLRITCNDGNNHTVDYKLINGNASYTIPTDTAILYLRADCASGKSFDHDRITIRMYQDPETLYPLGLALAKGGAAVDKAAANLDGALDLVGYYGTFEGRTHSGVTFSPIDHGFEVTGTAEDNAFCFLYEGRLFPQLTPGQNLNLFVETTNPNLVAVVLYFGEGAAYLGRDDLNHDGTCLIPAGTTNIMIRVQGYKGAAFDGDRITIFGYTSPQSMARVYSGLLTGHKAALEAESLELAELHDKKNGQLLFFGAAPSGAIDLEVGRGETALWGDVVKVTGSQYFVYLLNSGSRTLLTSGSHGLTISGFVSVEVFLRESSKADIVISTASGHIELEGINWYGTGGKPYAKLLSGSLSNVWLKYRAGDADRPVYLFGDSYISLSGETRWPYWVTHYGFDPWLMDGHGDRTSAQAILSFRTVMRIGRPRYVLWAMGMNDADTASAANAAWKSSVDEVCRYCDANGIEVVLATIPCTPTRNNVLKNEYVRSSGRRYIDFAAAVNGTVSGASWYAGMLSSDNVHPTVAGAFALASRAMLDMPELCGN